MYIGVSAERGIGSGGRPFSSLGLSEQNSSDPRKLYQYVARRGLALVTEFELVSMANISWESAIEGPAEYLVEHPRRLFVLFH